MKNKNKQKNYIIQYRRKEKEERKNRKAEGREEVMKNGIK